MAMSEDRMHERLGTYGQRWREQQPVPGLVPGGFGARRRTSPRLWVALAAAAAVAVIAGVTWAVHLSMDQTPATPGGPTPTLSPSSPPTSASPSPSPSPSTSPSTSAAAAPACLGSQLSASIGPHGPAAGTEGILILLHNTSDRTCTLGGLPTLTGVRSDGTVVDLGFRRTSGVGAPITPVTGGGTVAPGGQGAFAVSEGLNNCPKLGSFAKLRIALGAQGHVDMVWPAEFSVGCPSYQGPAGPIPDGPVHL
jgi:hypothetical protein